MWPIDQVRVHVIKMLVTKGTWWKNKPIDAFMCQFLCKVNLICSLKKTNKHFLLRTYQCLYVSGQKNTFEMYRILSLCSDSLVGLLFCPLTGQMDRIKWHKITFIVLIKQNHKKLYIFKTWSRSKILYCTILYRWFVQKKVWDQVKHQTAGVNLNLYFFMYVWVQEFIHSF